MSPDPWAGAPPVLVGGAGACGTTLAVDLLGLHPRLCPMYEPDCLVALSWLLIREGATAPNLVRARSYMERWAAPLPHRPNSKRPHELYHHGAQHLLLEPVEVADIANDAIREAARGRPGVDVVREVARLLAGAHLARYREDCPEAVRVIMKVPSFVECLPELRQIWPTMRFLHVVRDGRAFTASVLNRPWGPQTAHDAGAFWTNRMAMAEEDLDRHGMELHCGLSYERLVNYPTEWLAIVLRFIGEPDGGWEQVISRMRHKLDQGRLHAWRGTLRYSQVRDFELTARKTMIRWGYVPDTPP